MPGENRTPDHTHCSLLGYWPLFPGTTQAETAFWPQRSCCVCNGLPPRKKRNRMEMMMYSIACVKSLGCLDCVDIFSWTFVRCFRHFVGRPVKIWVLICWTAMTSLSFAHLGSGNPVYTTTPLCRLLLQQNPEWFDGLVLVCRGCPVILAVK